MTKKQFLGALRGKLEGEIPSREVERTLQYYESYIADQIKSGRTEREALEELGSPLLIAKTIIDTNAQENGYGAYEDQEDQPRSGSEENSFRVVRFGGWMVPVVLVILLIVVLTLLRVLLPILLPILLVCFFISMLRGK